MHSLEACLGDDAGAFGGGEPWLVRVDVVADLLRTVREGRA